MTTKILELTVATLVFSSLVATPRTEQPVSAEALDIGSRRELFVDDYLIDSVKGTARFPIATGVIEGACRYLVKDRMEVTGARWSLAGAEAVRLRALG